MNSQAASRECQESTNLKQTRLMGCLLPMPSADAPCAFEALTVVMQRSEESRTTSQWILKPDTGFNPWKILLNQKIPNSNIVGLVT
jgi:hypothetical protein